MKRLLISLLQFAITAFLLWWIFHVPTTRAQMAEALRTANYLWLLPGILSVGVACLLQAERWRILLAAQNIHLGWWRTVRVYLIGAFFNLFLLGATGGDIVKIFYAMRETSSKSAALLSVLVDRMMGLLGLVAVTAVLCTLRLDLLLSKPFTKNLLFIFLLIMCASLASVITGFVLDRLHLAHRLPRWLPLHAKLTEMTMAFSTYARSPRVLLATFGLSIPSHLLLFFAFYCSARAFGLFAGPGGLLDIFSTLPAIMTIAAMPISFSGLGVREGLFQEAFGALFGTPMAVAAMVSMTGFLMVVFWGLVGGLIYMLYRPSGGIHLREVQEEISEAEGAIENQA